MADTKPFPRTVASITREGLGPQSHAYDAPDLSPLQFLLEVMHAKHLPLATRIKAASAALPFFESKPNEFANVRCRIVIGGIHSDDLSMRQGQGPSVLMNESGTEGPEQINTISQSFSRDRSYSHHPSSETPGPLYTETNSYPQTLIDYSSPPTPAEIQQIAAVVHQLRPDLAHLPIPTPHLCACGHWIFGRCGCPSGTKLN